MRLYTIQTLAFWELSRQRGVITPDPDLIEQDFRKAYDWMKGQMAKRLPNCSGDYPVWAWVKRPDLRTYSREIYESPHVLLALEVTRDRVLISDFDGWHTVLNNWYMAIDEVDFETKFKVELPMEQIRASWERIFTPDALSDYVSDHTLQACIDRVYVQEVLQVRPIAVRRKRTG